LAGLGRYLPKQIQNKTGTKQMNFTNTDSVDCSEEVSKAVGDWAEEVFWQVHSVTDQIIYKILKINKI
jgi:hypothetical protein